MALAEDILSILSGLENANHGPRPGARSHILALAIVNSGTCGIGNEGEEL